MQTLGIPELATFIIGLLTLIVGELLTARIPLLIRLNIPAAVVGGLLTSVLVSIIELNSSWTITFAPHIRDILILLFFVSLGLTAKVSSLRSGGKPLVIICVITVLLLALQNIIGIAVALVNGSHPFYGLLAGSISFVGGPGTALAWAKEAESMGLQGADLVAVSAATFAVSIGALISGPVTGWIVERHKLHSAGPDNSNSSSANTPKKDAAQKPVSTSVLVRTMLLICVAVWIGMQLNTHAQLMNLLLPGFLCSLIAGMFITNLADGLRWRLPLEITDRVGDLALQVFLAMSLMSLKLSAIGAILVPLLAVVVLQVLASIAVAYLILFRLLGRNYDAAVTVGGFLGYAVSSMPVAMATMDKVTQRYGPSPNAILWITLAGSFFVDLANAFLVKGFVSLLPYLPGG